ncbi:DNA-binding IclR family transcriptional regulator [Rhodococcus sp. 27YEA15]|uniref:IclR family transcriptional regulator n=1 Tax=Rhodococcus sp. 27YEA15 TaxID=3156259 RepID=UPI003C7CE889
MESVLERPETTAGVVSSVAKAARLLRALSRSNGEAGVTELALAAGLPKSTAHRVLAELIQEEMVAHSGSRYALGAGWYALQMSRSTSMWGDLLDIARRPLENVFEATGANVHLAVLEGGQVLYLEKLTARGGTRIPTRVGARMPATCTAIGKALLAFSDVSMIRSVLSHNLPRPSARSIVAPRLLLDQLAEVRRVGYSQDLEESQLGLFCVAAPVVTEGRSVAAVSLARLGSSGHMVSDRNHVRRTALQIAQALSTPY